MLIGHHLLSIRQIERFILFIGLNDSITANSTRDTCRLCCHRYVQFHLVHQKQRCFYFTYEHSFPFDPFSPYGDSFFFCTSTALFPSIALTLLTPFLLLKINCYKSTYFYTSKLVVLHRMRNICLYYCSRLHFLL